MPWIGWATYPSLDCVSSTAILQVIIRRHRVISVPLSVLPRATTNEYAKETICQFESARFSYIIIYQSKTGKQDKQAITLSNSHT